MAGEIPQAKVRLEISFKDAQNAKNKFPEEEVTGVTAKGYEIVDVAGLVFRRRQKSRHTATPFLAENTPGAEAASVAEADGAIGAPRPVEAEMECDGGAATQTNLEEAAGQQAEQEPGNEGSNNASNAEAARNALDALAAIPDSAAESQRLRSLCAHVAEAAVAALEQESGREAQRVSAGLRSVLDRFAAGLQSALEEATVMCEEEQPAALHKAAGTSVEARTGVEDLLHSYKMEAQAWDEVAEQSDALFQQAADAKAKLPEGKGITAEDAELPTLQGMRANSHEKMAFQVESLWSMVETVEEMVALAELQCGEMQAEYHREKFRSFPHVDSPARLIHEIVRARSLFPAVPMRVG